METYPEQLLREADELEARIEFECRHVKGMRFSLKAKRLEARRLMRTTVAPTQPDRYERYEFKYVWESQDGFTSYDLWFDFDLGLWQHSGNMGRFAQGGFTWETLWQWLGRGDDPRGYFVKGSMRSKPRSIA